MTVGRIPCVVALAFASACARTAPARPVPPLPHGAYAHYLDGKLAEFGEDWNAAAGSLTAAARAAPDQPMIAVALARALAKAKQSERARATLSEARRRWPRHPEVWLASGDLLALADADHEAAVRAYRRAVELAANDERGYLGLARLAPAGQAEAVLRQLVERVPSSVEGHYRLAQLLAKRGQHAAAKAELAAVIEYDPDHLDARLALARALRRTGDLTRAIAQTRSAFDRSGQALDIADELFGLLCEADDRTAAIDLLTLLDDDRSDLEALAHVARLYRGLGLLPQARAVASRIAIVDPEAGAVLEAELEATTNPGAIRRLLEVAPTSKRFVESRRIAAEALLHRGDASAADAAIQPAIARAAENTDALLVAARTRAALGDRVGAEALVARIAGQPGKLARARLADQLGELDAAIAIAEPLLAEVPESAAAHNFAGYLLADADRRLHTAERWLRTARDLAPGDPAILDSWGWMLFRKGERRAAILALDHAARFAPGEPEILFHLASVWAADGAPRTAVAILERALTLSPPPAVRAKIETLRAALTGSGTATMGS